MSYGRLSFDRLLLRWDLDIEPKERTDMEMHRYPREEGDTIVLGPEIFADKDGAVISWKGENYITARWRTNAQDAIRRALDELGVPGPDYPAPVANAVEILNEVLGRTEPPYPVPGVEVTAEDAGEPEPVQDIESVEVPHEGGRNRMTIHGEAGHLLVKINPDGSLEYGEGYDPDEAAQTFWQAMARHMPGVEPEDDGTTGELTAEAHRRARE